MTYYFSDILENISLSSGDIQFHDMLTEDNEAWTIQVTYPEGTSAVPPLLCENDTLISLETPELFTNNDISEEKVKTDLKKRKVKQQQHIAIKDRYKCPNCEKNYNARRNLTRHINSECGKKPRFACPYCDYKNYRRNEFRKHIKSKHNISWDSSDAVDILLQVCGCQLSVLITYCLDDKLFSLIKYLELL